MKKKREKKRRSGKREEGNFSGERSDELTLLFQADHEKPKWNAEERRLKKKE